MPSQLHESHLFLFRNQPALAADLIRGALGVTLPSYAEARVISAELTEVQPPEYRADMVIELWRDAPVYGIVVEVQLCKDEHKQFAWPAYVANLRARLKCPVSLLVITVDDAVSRWAARCLDIGGLNRFTPYVLGPSAIPQVTEETHARENPELAVLSAMAHGRDSNPERAIEIALAAQKASVGLDAARSKIYCDLIMSSLGEAARRALKSMDTKTYVYQSWLAHECLAEGEAKGLAEGLAEGLAHTRALVVRMLTRRFGQLDEPARALIQRASFSDLDAIGERLLTAHTLQDALGSAATR
jgi:Domain of unknown function (DUF4351)